MNGLEALFEQHPPPWTFDDNRPGFRGGLIVYDANGDIVISTGGMEDCTGADIALAHAIAALPELLKNGALILAFLDGSARQPTSIDIRSAMEAFRAALDKAGAI